MSIFNFNDKSSVSFFICVGHAYYNHQSMYYRPQKLYIIIKLGIIFEQFEMVSFSPLKPQSIFFCLEYRCMQKGQITKAVIKAAIIIYRAPFEHYYVTIMVNFDKYIYVFKLVHTGKAEIRILNQILIIRLLWLAV